MLKWHHQYSITDDMLFSAVRMSSCSFLGYNLIDGVLCLRYFNYVNI